jgi:serine/threonine protein kinase
LVRGPTLAERLVQGPIPINEAIVLAKQIVNGLEAAHEKGIIHRDLRPVTPEGTVKVLVFVFGLAKAAEGSFTSATADATNPPAHHLADTRRNVVVHWEAGLKRQPKLDRGVPDYRALAAPSPVSAAKTSFVRRDAAALNIPVW